MAVKGTNNNFVGLQSQSYVVYPEDSLIEVLGSY